MFRSKSPSPRVVKDYFAIRNEESGVLLPQRPSGDDVGCCRLTCHAFPRWKVIGALFREHVDLFLDQLEPMKNTTWGRGYQVSSRFLYVQKGSKGEKDLKRSSSTMAGASPYDL